ncbi:hypothetical protein ABPG72_002122 [Tetrahymena utriculariae]
MRLKQKQISCDDEDLAREKVQNKVAIVKATLKPCKRKRRKNKQIQWVPFILRNNINYDSEPIYISFFKKFMRKYDNQYYNEYCNYGLIDAGYITIEQMTLDKTYGNLLVQIRNHSSGIINFQHLIDLYKSYQDQQYYELANLLDIYQTYHKNQIKHIQYYLNQEISINNITQEEIDEAYTIFQQDAIDWAQQNFENEIYEMSIICMNLETKTPVLKQKVFSKNLIMFITRDFYNFYSKLSCQNMKENLSLILHGDEFDGRLQLENRIKMMKQTLNGETCIQVEDEIMTAEGLVIPTTKQIHLYFYDQKTREISKKHNYFFIHIIQYNFEANQIQRLINMRQQNSWNDLINQKNNNDNSQDHIITNFDSICQQEYFLEKFNYI